MYWGSKPREVMNGGVEGTPPPQSIDPSLFAAADSSSDPQFASFSANCFVPHVCDGTTLVIPELDLAIASRRMPWPQMI